MPDVPDWAAPGGSPDDPGTPPAWAQPPSAPAQPAAWTPPPATWSPTGGAGQPGVIPLRPLGVGELLDGAITTIRRYPRATLGLSAVVVTVTQLVQFFATRAFTEDLADDGFSGVGSAGFVLSLLLSLVSGVLLAGALTVIMGQAVLGRPISLAEAWAAVRARFWALLGCALAVTLLMGLALVLCILPFFYAWPALSLATPALMLERQTVGNAIRRSQALVKGQFWRCLGVVSLAAFIGLVIEGAVQTPFMLAGGGFAGFVDGTADATSGIDTMYLLLTTVGAIVAGTLVAPFSAGVSALLYVDRRMRAEGLDVTLAAEAAAGRAGPTGTTPA